ncbi:MAG: hypothetical protein ACKOPT_14615, partial [Cyanobium sp.]
VGRQPALASVQEWVGWLTALAAPGAHLRFLFSQPRMGPATALGTLLRSPAAGTLLERAKAIEAQGLDKELLFPPSWVSALEGQGWQLQEQVWEESLELQLVEPLLERWFSPLAPYRIALETAGWTPPESKGLRSLFAAHMGARLPQRLRHGVLEGRLLKAAAQQKSPGRGRGKRG